MAVACVLTLVVLEISAARAEGGGVIQGRVEIQTPLARRAVGHRRRQTRYGPGQTRAPAASPGPADEVRHVVVYLAGPSAPRPRPLQGARMVQKDRQFIPYVLPVTVGTTVSFPNMDTVFHGIYSDSPPRPFELPEYPQGETRSVRFDRPGVVELFCGIHSHMNAYILVLENACYAQPDARHVYRIAGVPPGDWKLVAWHPRLPALERQIHIKEGQTLEMDLRL
jgi:plastocyanin